VTALDDDIGELLHRTLDHSRTRVETTVERAILSTLGGGCVAPMGVHAVVQGQYVKTRVQVFDRDGDDSVVASRDLDIETHVADARTFAEDLADRGAAELVAEARRAADDDAESAPPVDRSDEEPAGEVNTRSDDS
jgi:hydroxymethylbilane synthase